MSYFVTLVASDNPLGASHLDDAKGLLDQEGISLAGTFNWLCPDKAADIPVQTKPSLSQIKTLRALFARDALDVFVTSAHGRQK